jgi:hypothetical protein
MTHKQLREKMIEYLETLDDVDEEEVEETDRRLAQIELSSFLTWLFNLSDHLDYDEILSVKRG